MSLTIKGVLPFFMYAGKSNVFAAVEFVLSNRFSSLRAEERQRLLHEGSGRAPLSAYVEITFDNRSRRFPDDRDEVTLKRVIGLKKDEYLLNSKHISKTQLDNLLESSGFSRSNPYNIVQQGKVAALLKMSDVQRLDLLKEIAGTRVYDQRRAESLKVMKDALVCRDQIQEVSDSLDSRLGELEEEQAELHNFQQCDKKRRAVEFAVFTKEQTNAEKKLLRLDEERRELHDQSEQFHAKFSDLKEAREKIEVEISETTMTVERCEKEMESLRKDLNARVKEKTKLELLIQDEEQTRERQLNSCQESKEELISLKKEVKSTTEQLNRVEADFEARKEREDEASAELQQSQNRITDLYAKQGRCREYQSESQRNAYLEKEIAERRSRLKEDKAQLKDSQTQLRNLQAKLQRSQAKEINIQEQIASAKDEIRERAETLKELKRQRDEATNARKYDCHGWHLILFSTS